MPKKVFLITGLLLVFLIACGGEDSVVTVEEATLDPNSAAGHGKTLFSTYCAICHSVDEGTVLVGPSLAGISSAAAIRVNDLDAATYLNRSILYPDNFVVEGYEVGTMQQNFASILTSEEVDDLVAYLITLRNEN
ncbi:MAG: cytochrome c [Chloroflexi bacterium]|nr:cytochrome c [Chloroflexota bacterium]